MPTTSHGAPYSDLSAAPNIPADIQALAVWANTLVPIIYTDLGLATSTPSDFGTTATRGITDPFGAGKGFRCRATYTLGYVTAAAGVTGRACIYVNGALLVGSRWALISPLSSAHVTLVYDMPAGGTVTFQGVLASKSAAMATIVDGGSHLLTTEVSRL